MILKEKFETILKNKTRNSFHDSSLIEILMNIEKREIVVIIEHLKDGELDNEEHVYTGKFLFNKISNIDINNDVECLSAEDEISSFECTTKNSKFFFSIIGIKGWTISFSAEEFEYTEIFKETIRY